MLVLGIIGIAVVLPVTSDVISDTAYDVQTLGLGEEFNVAMDTNESLANGNLVSGTDVMVCPDWGMISGTDYTIDLIGGVFNIPQDAITLTNNNFTTLHDNNVTLWTAQNNIASIKGISLIVYNCSNSSQTWKPSGNYTSYPEWARVNVISTGQITNNTVICYNATGSRTYSGAPCTIEYEWYVSGGDGLGTTGMTATIIDLLPIFIAVILLFAMVGYISLKS
jgi:hypothetical protein